LVDSLRRRYITLFYQAKPKIGVQALACVSNRFVEQFHDKIQHGSTRSAAETVETAHTRIRLERCRFLRMERTPSESVAVQVDSILLTSVNARHTLFDLT
jgi:hypothetical protein